MKAKLVRDKSGPVKDGCCATANSLQGKHMALLLKLHEEASEIADAATDPNEYADVLEVLLELAKINEVSWDSIEEALLAKREKLGGFRMAQIWSEDVPKTVYGQLGWREGTSR